MLLGQLGVFPAGATEDLDARLEEMLSTLKQELLRQEPARATARVVVANFTEDGLTWGTPLTAYLQERAAWLVETKSMFRPPAVPRTRGITIKQVTGVANPNDPKALAGLYGSDLAIDGSYRREGDRVLLRLVVLDDQPDARAVERHALDGGRPAGGGRGAGQRGPHEPTAGRPDPARAASCRAPGGWTSRATGRGRARASA